MGPKADGAPNTDVDIPDAIAALENASLKSCGGFTIHRGKGGWMGPAIKIVKKEAAILVVSGSYESIRKIAALGKRLLGATAVHAKKPDGSTILL